ncbi:ADP-ribose glycohydrolase MACROD2 [Penicillium herquei]|nr:ADP-ribose glycohydrolase MACROD2 [Penicillium herquei]
MASPVITLGEIPTLSHLYRTGKLHVIASSVRNGSHPPSPITSSSATHRSPIQSLNDKVSYLKDDITKLKVDGIVNAANRALEGGGGVDGAIHRAAGGTQLLDACRELRGCDTGDAKITPGFNLPAHRVIHTVGPVYGMEFRRDPSRPEQLLRSCYRRSLEVAAERGVRTLAFSCVSTGIYGYPNEDAAFIAADEVRTFLLAPENAGKIDRVIFCLFQQVDVDAYVKILPQIFPPTTEDTATLTNGA